MNTLIIEDIIIHFATDNTSYDEAWKELEEICERYDIKLYGGYNERLLNADGDMIDWMEE